MLEDTLEREVSTLPGVDALWIKRGGVGFHAPLDCVYWTNTHLNTAHRVLLRIGTFSAGSFSMLFDQIRRVPWELWIPQNGTFGFRVSSRSSKLNMRDRIAATCCAGVEERLATVGVSANRSSNPQLQFVLRLVDNRATLSLDTSGEHLHKRGYKRYSVKAPVRETLAAAILMRANFADYDLVLDPFCGSGTFLLEGARMAMGIPPGHSRKFAFSTSPFFNEAKLRRAQERVDPSRHAHTRFLGFDISARAVEASEANVKLLGAEGLVTIQQRDFRKSSGRMVEVGKRGGLVVTNPPYRKRLSASGVDEGTVLTRLSTEYPGWTAALLTKVNLAALTNLPSALSRSVSEGEISRLTNGGIRTYLHLFEVP